MPTPIQVNHDSIPNLDIHEVAGAGGPPKTVLFNADVYSCPDGDNWTSLNVKQNFSYGYARGVNVQPDDPCTIFVNADDTAAGRVSAVVRSRDTGQIWAQILLPADPNTGMWVVNIQTFDPKLVLAGSR